MRIVGGSLRGRRFRAPNSIPARPTTDQAKEALFNILTNRINWGETEFLDLFAGIGSISIEAASRGAKSLTSIDINHKSVQWIKELSKDLDIYDLHAVRADVMKWLKKDSDRYDLVFADPPYNFLQYTELIDLVLKNALQPDGFFVLEHRQSNSFAEHPNFEDERTYGEVKFSFFNT